MSKKLITAIALAAIATSGLMIFESCNSSSGQQGNVLLPDVTLSNDKSVKTKLSEIFDDFKVVQLSTSDSTLISTREIKIFKRNGIFYIQSANDIYQFDKNGVYLSALKRNGNGPGEYTGINDFDIVKRDGKTEIWVASMKNILRYDAANLEYLGDIQEDFFVNQIKYVNDSTIFCTTNENKYFRVIDIDGKQKGEYFDVNFPNSLQRQHGFKIHDGYVTYQFSNSDEAMTYSIDKKEVGITHILPMEDYFETMAIGDEYYEKYDMKFGSMLAEKYVEITNYQQLGDKTTVTSRWPDKKWKYTVGGKGIESATYTYFPESESLIENDILTDADPRLLATQVCSDSDDSILFIDEYSEDSNPRLLEVFKLK